MNEVSSRSHAVCIIIVEKCTTILNANNNTDATAAAAAAAMACDNMGLLMAGGGPSSRKAVAAAAALSGKLQHTIKVRAAWRQTAAHNDAHRHQCLCACAPGAVRYDGSCLCDMLHSAHRK